MQDIIEKHITLDRKRIGMDNQMAMEPDDLKTMITKCRDIQIALGSKKRMVLSKEYEQRKNMRRSIIVTRDIKQGETLKREDLDVKRPGIGFPPEYLDNLIGCIAVHDIENDTVIQETDIQGI